MRKYKLTRDTVLLTIGAVAFFHEVFLSAGPADATIVYASLALMGLPFVLRAEEKVRNGNGTGS